MTFILGLTGSIGMGKSTTAQMFAAAGIPVWDADATVHLLYQNNTRLITEIDALVPGAAKSGGIDRSLLKSAIARDKRLLDQIERLLAPELHINRVAFVKQVTADIALIDHPLLFESGTDTACNAVLLVSTDAATQRERVLARDTISEEMLETILCKQTSDAEKRARADFIIRTTTLQIARKGVHKIIRAIRSRQFA
ncbi:MAG: dephospho-CoA kinase [Rhodobacteraceae bacterium]|nr:dephospho-CoA kinase [Paracoccaceae bacterium]